MWGHLERAAKPICSAAAPLFAFTLVGAAVHVGVVAPVNMSPQQDALRQVSAAVSLAAAIDTSSNAVGIAESSLYFMTPEEIDVALDTMQSLGVTQLRMFVPWRAVETAPGVYNWADVDKVVDAAYERDIAVLGAVTSTPTWASDVQGSAYGAPRDPDDYGEFMGALASRYGAGTGDPETARISAYEVWNEPHSFVFWAPKPDPAAYTEILKSAYTAIKAVDPNSTVVGGVVTAGQTFGDLSISPVDFVQRMYDSGAAGYFDALSYHPYHYDWKFGDGEGYDFTPIGQLETMQALMEQYGDGDKTVWTTEYGLHTAGLPESQQAEFLDNFMDTWSEHEDTGPMFLYSLVDQNTGTAEIEDNWGLFRDDWTPKQAAAVVQAWIEENGPIPTDDLPAVDEIPDLAAPTLPALPVVDEPAAEAPVDPVAEAVANWQKALADAAASWAAAWSQAQNPAPATVSASRLAASDPEVAPAADADLAEAVTEATATSRSTQMATTDPADEAAETTSTATDPAWESTESSRAALVEATQAGAPTESESVESDSETTESVATPADVAAAESEAPERPTAEPADESDESTDSDAAATESDSAPAESTADQTTSSSPSSESESESDSSDTESASTSSSDSSSAE